MAPASCSQARALSPTNGEIYTVRYDAVNAMLLNEFLKEHKRVESQQATIAELKSTVAQQQKRMEVLTAQLKEQAAQTQKVIAQIEISKSAHRTAGRIRRGGPVPQVVANRKNNEGKEHENTR
jgi:septal ring factor EnvC (AmiA/AmiB activator)